MMIRGILTNCVEGVIKRFAALGLIEVSDRELFQHYGFTSRPQEGAEVVYLVEGNLVIAIGSDDRRYRIAIESGEAAIYDDLGQKVHLTRDGIVIESPWPVTINAAAINLGNNTAELRALIDERLLERLNNHTHGGIQTGQGTSGPPSDAVTSDMVCTQITQAA